MKRQVKDIIKENIYNNSSSFNDKVEITKSLRVESFIRFIFSLSFFIFIMIFNEKITKLSIITSDTILSHRVFFRPDILFFFVLAFALFLNTLSFSSSFFINSITKIKTKTYFIIYRLYDFVSFICSMIIVIDFIILFIITPVTVSGNSMNHTLKNGDKCLIWHFMYEPKNDDIIILDSKKYSGEEKFFVKRIVASSGDTLRIQGLKDNYYFYVNDVVVEKRITLEQWANITGDYISYDKQFVNKTYIVPKNKYVIMGDNRAPSQSYDSRNFGLVDKCDIIGRLVLRYYPFNRFGTPDKTLCEVL